MEDCGWRGCKNVFKKQFEKAIRNDAAAFDSNTAASLSKETEFVGWNLI
jgi:hypothetical protein